MKTKIIITMKNIELNTFKQLFLTNFAIFKKNLLDKLIDFIIWVVATTSVYAYVFPLFGMSEKFAIFQLGGICASAGLFQAWGNAFSLVADLEESNVMSYYLTLPIRPILVFLQKILFYTVSYSILTLVVLPIAQLVIPYKFSILNINFTKYFIILFISNLFYGALTLWLVSKVKNIHKMESVWTRFVFPLWFLGGFQFSWLSINEVSKFFSYVLLLNPIVYIMEAYRIAVLNQQEGYLNFWLCLIAILIFTVLLTLNAISGLKKKLDFIV